MAERARPRRAKPGRAIESEDSSYLLANAIKLGISYTIARSSTEVLRPLTPRDFKASCKERFPPGGGDKTPAHGGEDFVFKEYAPQAFRQIREHFGVDPSRFILSLGGEKALRSLASKGKSGASFLGTHDGSLLAKSVSKREARFLVAALPSLYVHLLLQPATLLVKILGLYRVKLASGSMRFVVMENILPAVPVERYDLKGSTLGRAASSMEKGDVHGVRKDLDFHHIVRLPPDLHRFVERSIRADCDLLVSFQVIDYSLLVGFLCARETEVAAACRVDPPD